jgi:hypothetical protein
VAQSYTYTTRSENNNDYEIVNNPQQAIPATYLRKKDHTASMPRGNPFFCLTGCP